MSNVERGLYAGLSLNVHIHSLKTTAYNRALKEQDYTNVLKGLSKVFLYSCIPLWMSLLCLDYSSAQGAILCKIYCCPPSLLVRAPSCKPFHSHIFLHLCADCKLHDAGKLLPPAAAPDPPPIPQAAHCYVAQESAAQRKVRPLGIRRDPRRQGTCTSSQ